MYIVFIYMCVCIYKDRRVILQFKYIQYFLGNQYNNLNAENNNLFIS